MSHYSTEPTTRPGMRRKSSAQNILSSFKNSSGAANIPPPLNLSAATNSNQTSLSFAQAITPTAATTPLLRDNWDAQSLHSESVPPSLAGAQSPQLGQGTSLEYLRDLVQKRIITLTYIRSIHEGRSHWFHTILISQSELQKVFNNTAMKKRTYRFAVLGLSLSTLLDINQPQDLLRGLLNTITEYDQSKEESDNKSSKMRIKFKGRNPKKGPSGIAEFYTEGASDASYLLAPNMPFPLDYLQTLLSLLDVLSEVYNKISKLLGPSPFPHSTHHMMGPLGLLSPHPGVSYLFAGEAQANQAHQNQNYGQGQNLAPGPMGNSLHGHSNPNLHLPQVYVPTAEDMMNGSLWSIANATPSGAQGGGMGMIMGMGVSPPAAVTWTPALGEMVLKIDGKLKKISSTLLKDLDTFARNGVREELASLDPLLRNISVPDDGSKYEFEGI